MILLSLKNSPHMIEISSNQTAYREARGESNLRDFQRSGKSAGNLVANLKLRVEVQGLTHILWFKLLL